MAPGAFADLVVVNGTPLDDLALPTGQGRHMPPIIKDGAVAARSARF